MLNGTGRERTANISQPAQTFWLPDYSTLLCFLQILFTWARSEDETLESLYSDFLLLSVKTRDTINFPLFPAAYQGPEVTRVLPYRIEKTQPPSWLKLKSEDETEERSPKGKQNLPFFLFKSSKNKGNVKLLDTWRRGGREAVMLSQSSMK